MQRFILFIALCFINVALFSADHQYGTVRDVNGDELVIAMEDKIEIANGAIIAIYGPGSVRKHPLTQQVLVETKKLIANAKIIRNRPSLLAKVIWAETTIQAGYDAIYESGARPNGSPQLTNDQPQFVIRSFNGDEKPITRDAIPAQSTIRIKLPIIDPDDDGLDFTWSVEGKHPGYLHQRFSGKPEILWTAPALADQEITLTAHVTDEWGQTFEYQTVISTVATVEDWNRRQPIRGGIREDAKPNQVMGIRLATNRRLSLSNDGKLFIHQGCFSQQALSLETTPRSIRRIKPTRDGGFMALSRYTNKVHRFDQNGKEVVRYEGLYEPSDMVELIDGTIAVGDPERKGIELFAANGVYLARIGRDFSISRLAASTQGDLFALDGNRIRRFDRWWRPQSTFDIPTSGSISVIDIVHTYTAEKVGHILVLLSSGVVMRFEESGKLVGTYEEVLTHPLLKGSGTASSIQVANHGLITIHFGESGNIARLNSDGLFHSCRFELPNYGRYAYGNGELWVADSYKKNIYKIDNQGWIVGGMKSPDNLRSISVMTASPDGELLGVLDKGNKQVNLLGARDNTLSPIVFGQSGRDPGQFRTPVDLAMDESGRSYIVDAGSDKIVIFDKNGTFLFEQSLAGKDPHHLDSPEHIVVSPDGSYCAIYDDDDYLIKQYTIDHSNKTMEHRGNIGGRGSDPGRVRAVTGLAVDRLGLIYVADSTRDDVQIWDVRGGNAVTIDLLKGEKLGLGEVSGISVSADGVFVVWNSRDLVLHHW